MAEMGGAFTAQMVGAVLAKCVTVFWGDMLKKKTLVFGELSFLNMTMGFGL